MYYVTFCLNHIPLVAATSAEVNNFLSCSLLTEQNIKACIILKLYVSKKQLYSPLYKISCAQNHKFCFCQINTFLSYSYLILSLGK